MSIKTTHFTGTDGTSLALHHTGDCAGKPLILLHGLFSSAEVNWIKYGHAARLAEAGFRVFMPDLRAHGHSDAPHDPANYPADVLADDLAALVAHLGLADYDLGGFSLGARTAARGVLAGLSPRRLILGGMGLEGLSGWRGRLDHFTSVIDDYDSIERGDPRWFAVQFMKTMKIDRTAARLLLGTMTDTAPADLTAITMPTLVVCGRDDRDNGSPHALADALPTAQLAEIEGTHMSCITKRGLSEEMVRFLSA